jgi:hypothetical protein
LAGHTLYADPMQMFPILAGGHLTLFVAADGVLYGTFKAEPDLGTERDLGRWHITPDR